MGKEGIIRGCISRKLTNFWPLCFWEKWEKWAEKLSEVGTDAVFMKIRAHFAQVVATLGGQKNGLKNACFDLFLGKNERFCPDLRRKTIVFRLFGVI